MKHSQYWSPQCLPKGAVLAPLSWGHNRTIGLWRGRLPEKCAVHIHIYEVVHKTNHSVAFDRFWWNLVRRCILGFPIWWSTKNLKFQTPRWWKSKNCDISKTVWPVLLKFCRITHKLISSPELTSCSKKINF